MYVELNLPINCHNQKKHYDEDLIFEICYNACMKALIEKGMVE